MRYGNFLKSLAQSDYQGGSLHQWLTVLGSIEVGYPRLGNGQVNLSVSRRICWERNFNSATVRLSHVITMRMHKSLLSDQSVNHQISILADPDQISILVDLDQISILADDETSIWQQLDCLLSPTEHENQILSTTRQVQQQPSTAQFWPDDPITICYYKCHLTLKIPILRCLVIPIAL